MTPWAQSLICSLTESNLEIIHKSLANLSAVAQFRSTPQWSHLNSKHKGKDSKKVTVSYDMFCVYMWSLWAKSSDYRRFSILFIFFYSLTQALLVCCPKFLFARSSPSVGRYGLLSDRCCMKGQYKVVYVNYLRCKWIIFIVI